KQKLGQLEMKDLEYISIQALRDFPEVGAAFASEWDYWLIDEFQDTSPAQVELLHQLIGKKPVFFVGDPQQSIYLFRGARSEVFAEEENSILQRSGQLSELKKNYRSQPELLLFFNDFFKQFDQKFLEMEPRESAKSHQTVVAKFQIVEKENLEPYSPLVQRVLQQIKEGAQYEDFCI
ncbi:MAG: UvrD-helicase domain-containing protein, partial [Bdellovibrionales bacterium]|nr:UvrD-helicase domain-containing protein [Bdellovibrionales bacterium]